MDTQLQSDRDRYIALIEHHRRLIRFLCWRHSMGSEALCKELVQECYITILSRMDSLRPEAHAMQRTAWVVLQCRSVFSHRRRSWEPEWVPLDGQLADSLAAPDDSGDRELLDELAADLDPSEQQLLQLLLDDLSEKEIAARMHLSPSAVSKKKNRMIEKMRQAYEQQTSNPH